MDSRQRFGQRLRSSFSWGANRRGEVLDLLHPLDIVDAVDAAELVDEALEVAQVDRLDDEL